MNTIEFIPQMNCKPIIVSVTKDGMPKIRSIIENIIKLIVILTRNCSRKFVTSVGQKRAMSNMPESIIKITKNDLRPYVRRITKRIKNDSVTKSMLTINSTESTTPKKKQKDIENITVKTRKRKTSITNSLVVMKVKLLHFVR